jgi:hypothetical protein
MGLVWRSQRRSTARTALWTMLALAVTSVAMGQTLASETSDARSSSALEGDTSGASGDTAQLPGPRGRAFMTALFAVPLVTFAGPVGFRGSEVVSPAERLAITQIVGVGYVVNPRFRFGVMGIFNEVFTGSASDAWQFGGVAPIAIGTFGHFVIGSGPLIGYRSAGRHQADAGVVVLSGALIPVRRGLSVNIVAPVTALFMHRRTVSVGVAAGVAKVF